MCSKDFKGKCSAFISFKLSSCVAVVNECRCDVAEWPGLFVFTQVMEGRVD